VTDVFEVTGRAMAEQWGVPTYRFLVMPHPIANLSETQLDQRAREIAPEIVKLLLQGRSKRAGVPAPWWGRNAHVQTVWGPLFRSRARLRVRRERVSTRDGDFVDLDWADGGRAKARRCSSSSTGSKAPRSPTTRSASCTWRSRGAGERPR